MALETSMNPGQPNPEERQQEQFQPSWDEDTTRNLIKQYKNAPSLYGEQLDAIRQHAHYHNVPFYEGEFDILDAIKHAGAGFVEGFTTLKIAEPADNEYEQIFRNLGHLAGFAPGIMAGPAKLMRLKGLSRAAAALNDKSVPMMAANFLTKKAKGIVGPSIKAAQTARVGATKSATDFLLGNKARHIMEGAFHLGTASAVSSWQGGVDAMMDSFLHGGVAGAAFRTIGNVKIDGSERSQKVIRGVAGSLFMGLPTTIQGATTPEQVYQYVMGAYFGGNERPWTQAKAGNFLKNMSEKFKENAELNISKDPKLDPEWEALPEEVQPIVLEMAKKRWGDPDTNNLIHSILTEKVDPAKLTENQAEIAGFEPVEVDGEVKYKLKKDVADRIKSVMVSGGAPGADQLWTRLGARRGIFSINYTFKEHFATAARATGKPHLLKTPELETANAHVLKANETLKRPIENVKDYVYNLFRRNWKQVDNADAIYAIGTITRQPQDLTSLPKNHKDYAKDIMGKQHLLNKSVKGGTGWAVQMAIDNVKPVYVYDAPSRSWNTYDYAAQRFRAIKEPPKPPRKWAAIGSRFREEGEVVPKDIEADINKFLSKHFKTKSVKKTKKELADLSAKIDRGDINKDYIKHIDEQIEEIQARLASQGIGAPKSIKTDEILTLKQSKQLNKDIRAQKKLMEVANEELHVLHFDKELPRDHPKVEAAFTKHQQERLRLLELELRLLGKRESRAIDFDTGKESIRVKEAITEKIKPLESEIQKIREFLGRREFESLEEEEAYNQDKLSLENLQKERIDVVASGKNLFLNEITGEVSELQEVVPTKSDPDVGTVGVYKRDIDFVTKYMKDAWKDKGLFEEEVFSKEDISRSLQELLVTHSTGSKENLSEVVAEGLESRWKVKLNDVARGQLRQRMAELNLSKQVAMFGYDKNGKLRLLDSKHPISAAGQKKLLREPDNALQIAYEEAGGKDSGWGILDHITIVNRNGRNEDIPLTRYLTSNLFYANGNNMTKAQTAFNAMKADLMRQADGKGYYYFGGKGDNDRIYWAKYHPKLNVKEVDTLPAILKELRLDTDFRRAEETFIKNYGAGGKIPVIKNIHRKAYLSNMLYEVHRNFGPKEGMMSGMKKILGQSSKGKGDFISSSKAFNKRAQIWFTNSIGGDAKFIGENLKNNDLYVPEDKGQLSLFKDGEQGLYRFGIIKDLPRSIIDKMDADKFYSSDVKRRSNELGEHIDGGIIVRDDVLDAIIRDSGMEDSGQSKSFIVSRDPENGAILGKYMMHKAGPELSRQMTESKKHMYMPGSTVKQRGFRSEGELTHDKGKISFTGQEYYLNPSDVFYNYSVTNGKHMMDPQRVAKQLVGALLDNTESPIPKEVINDFFDSVIKHRFEGNPATNELYDRYVADKDPVKLAKLTKDFNKLSISKIIDSLKEAGNDQFADMAYRKMLRLQRDTVGEDLAAGEITKEEYDRAMGEISEFESQTDRRINAALKFISKQGAKGKEMSALGIFLHKEVRDWRMSVIKNFVVKETTKPHMLNSSVARMRPYDIAMQHDLDQANPLLRADNPNGINHKSDIFMLDNHYKAMRLKTSIRGFAQTTLGELWAEYGDAKPSKYGYKEAQQVFRSTVLRVPMDSISGAHVLKFKGFTGRDGHGILLNSKTMRALGGADLDGDEAWAFFGDEKHGFKEAWKDAIHNNKEEFYETIDAGKPTERRIVRDNKGADISPELRKDLGLKDKIKTFRDLLTISGDMSPADKAYYNSVGAMYSPTERIRISEAAVTGRMALGAAAVTPSQVIATAHSAMMHAKDRKDTFIVSKDIYNKTTGKYDTKEYRLTITPKTDPKWRKYAKELARAQVAFGSDPMDELGLRSTDDWYKKLWGANFNLVSIVDAKTGKAAKDMSFKKIDSLDLKNGIYKTIDNINKAYWGYNWTAGRRYTMPEIKDLASGIYDFLPEQINSVMSKTAELLQPLDWSDSIFNRLDATKLKNLYTGTHEYAKKYRWLQKLLERSSLTVPYTKYISRVMKEGNELYIPDRLEEVAMNEDLFIKTLGLVQDKKTKLWSNDFNLTEKMLKNWQHSVSVRRGVLEHIANQAEDFLVNDLSDMVTLTRVANLADTMTKEEIARIPGIHTEVDRLKLNSYLMKQERKKSGGFDLASLSDWDRFVLEDWIKEHPDQLHLLPKGIAASIGGGKTAALDQAQIDAEILKYYKDNNLSENEMKMFEYLMLGTYRRGDLAAVNDIEAKMAQGRKNNSRYGWNAPLVQLVKNMKQEAAKTSTSRLGYNSKAIREEAVEEMTGDYLELIDTSWKRPTEADIKEAQDSTDKVKTGMKESGTDYFEEDSPIAGEPYTEWSSGYEGLVKGVQMSSIPKAQRAMVSEILGHLKFYNKKVGQNLSGITRKLFGKDLNAMNLEDYKALNRWFRDIRTGTIWQQIFGKGGATKLAKRHWYLFPKTINRELMKDDIVLMEETGAYLTKDARALIGKMKKPTHFLDMTQQWISRMNDQGTEQAEKWVRELQERVLFIDAFKEGDILRQMAIREREAQYADSKTFNENPITAKIYKEIYSNPHKEIMALNKELLTKSFTLTIDGVRKGYTGREVMDVINREYTALFKNMHKLIRGKVDSQGVNVALKDGGYIMGYYDMAKKNPKIDYHKFIRHLTKAWRNGENPSLEFGIDGLRKVARSMLVEQNAKYPELAKAFKESGVTDTGKIKFEQYWPHMFFDKKKAATALKHAIKKLKETPLNEFHADPEKALELKKKELASIMYKHHNLTGEWVMSDIEEWQMVDEVLDTIGEKRNLKKDKIKWFEANERAGSMFSRDSHIEGWSLDHNVTEGYIRSITSSYYRQLSQIFSRDILDRMYHKMDKSHGTEQAKAWNKFMRLYVADAMGNPSIIPKEYYKDKTLKVRGTAYGWWADNNVAKRVDKIKKALGLQDKDLPKELRTTDLQTIRHWSNLEAQFEMAALLAHPKSMITNIFGGTTHTLQSAGLSNWRNARNFNWLKQNINDKWNSMEDVGAFVEKSGAIPEYMLYELGLKKEFREAKNKEFLKAVADKMGKDPNMSDLTLKEIAKKYKVKDRIVGFAAKFMTVPERAIRRDAFMAHYIQAWNKFGGALKDPNHPFLIEMAKKGVKATQFLYSAPFRPAFARTALGKVMARFQLWSWNAVRFRNDVIRQAKIHGFTRGTESYDRFVRTAQIDMFVFALANVFAYSLFETALPAPWNWFQDTSEWILGDETERDRAFFGQWPKQLAPLQMVTPPIFRLLPSSMRALVDDDWSKFSQYYIWTMFPFGRMARDAVGPGNLVENPIRMMEKLSGFPLLNLQKEAKRIKDSGEAPLTPGL